MYVSKTVAVVDELSEPDDEVGFRHPVDGLVGLVSLVALAERQLSATGVAVVNDDAAPLAVFLWQSDAAAAPLYEHGQSP